MLLEFSTANFRSINKRCTLSMLAQGIKEEPKNNYVSIDGLKILKSAVVYGANSSGKTNLILAMAEMQRNILDSVKLNDDDKLKYAPFLLTNEKGKPSYFEILFILGGVKYRYGFEHTSKSIDGEWLFMSNIKSKEDKAMFIRTKDGIGVDGELFAEGVGKEENTNDNRLFLSLCAQLGGSVSKGIMAWFKSYYAMSGIDSNAYKLYSKIMLHEKRKGYEKALALFEKLKLGFQGIETAEEHFDESKLRDDLSDEVRRDILKKYKGTKDINLSVYHNIYDNNGNIVDTQLFDVKYMESEGTRKIIELSGPIFDILENGELIIIDELDVKMHPLISQYIIDLFNNPDTNPNNAQLIFTTHDTNLLSSNQFRRDQIWFTEKDETEQTDLYNMMDIVLPDGSKPRNDANYEKNYIAGRYGAIPYIIYE